MDKTAITLNSLQLLLPHDYHPKVLLFDLDVAFVL